MWIFFPKKCRLFQLNVHFSNFEPLFHRKLRTPTVFMTYFQSSYHFVHAHKLWSSEIFCKKCCCSLKMLTNCYLFSHFCASFVTKLMKRPTIFMTYSQSSCQVTHADKVLSSQISCNRTSHTLKMLTKYYSFSLLWISFLTKVMKRPIAFLTYFPSFCRIMHVHKIFSPKSFWKKAASCFKMLINYYSFPQLSASFMTKLMKKSHVFITDMQSSYKLLLSEKNLMSPVSRFCTMKRWPSKKLTRFARKRLLCCSLRSFGLAISWNATFWLKSHCHMKSKF